MTGSPPTPARIRRDGWTGERRRLFLAALARRGNVRGACRMVGLSKQAVYRLRQRDPAFAAQWDAAMAPLLARQSERIAQREALCARLVLRMRADGSPRRDGHDSSAALFRRLRHLDALADRLGL